MKGTLYLIPTPIAEDTNELVLAPQIKLEIAKIRFFLAENVRTARRFLSSLKIFPSIEELDFKILDKDTPSSSVAGLMEPLINGHHIGLLSEAGCPGVADPGALAVRAAHELSARVVPLVGPSSILLALMASGLNGQRFSFHGYLPIDAAEAARAIRTLEKESRQQTQTQIAIETPYRNKSVFKNLINNLSDSTLLTVAIDITGADERINTKSVKEWKTDQPELAKAPAVFLFLAS